MLWNQVEAQAVHTPPAELKTVCRLVAKWAADGTGNSDRYAGALAKVLDGIAPPIASAGQVDASTTVAVDEPTSRSVRRDPRWALWQDLMRERRGEKLDGSGPTAPLDFTRVFDFSTDPVFAQWVEIRLDWRLSLEAVVAELRRLWPAFVAEGWVRRSRPLDEKAATLVRFVCLETPPDTPWQKRMELWNERHGRWTYADRRAFAKDFRRAEKRLTGRIYGLAWFYDSEIRSGDYEVDRWGSRSAIHAAQLAPMFGTLGMATERLAGEMVRRLKASGRTEAEALAWASAQLESEGTNLDPDDVRTMVHKFFNADPKDYPDPSFGHWRAER